MSGESGCQLRTDVFTKCSDKTSRSLDWKKKAAVSCKLNNSARLRESQVCSLRATMWWQGRLRLHKSRRLSDIFKWQISEKHTAAETKKKKKKGEGAFKGKRISTYLTPTSALVRPLYSHLALPSAIHAGLMMLQSGMLRLYEEREGGADGWGLEKGGRRILTSGEPSTWIHPEYSSVLSCLLWSWGSRTVPIYTNQ